MALSATPFRPLRDSARTACAAALLFAATASASQDSQLLPPESVPGGYPVSRPAPAPDDPRLALEARFLGLGVRIESLMADSAAMPESARPRYLAAVRAAIALCDEIHYRLSELRNLELQGSRRLAWERLLERTGTSLTGLARFADDLEAFRARRSADPGLAGGPVKAPVGGGI